MTLTALLSQTVTVTHATRTGAVDKYGDPTEETSTSTYRGHVQQERRWDRTGLAEIQSEEWRLYLEPGAVIDGGDRVTVDEVTYEVMGPPWQTFNPRTRRVAQVEATLKRIV